MTNKMSKEAEELLEKGLEDFRAGRVTPPLTLEDLLLAPEDEEDETEKE